MIPVRETSPESKRDLLALTEAGDILPGHITGTTMVEDDPGTAFLSLQEWAGDKVRGKEYNLLLVGEARKMEKLRDIALAIALGEVEYEKDPFILDGNIWHSGK